MKLRVVIVGLAILLVVFVAGRAQFSKTRNSFAASKATKEAIPTATNKLILPDVAQGAIFQELNPGVAAAPNRRATYGAGVAVSPDGKRLAILTSGFPAYYDANGNFIQEASMEYVFVFDTSGPAPRQLQVLPVPNTFQGLAWSPRSDRIFVSGGKDDTVVEFVDSGANFVPGRTVRLGHKGCLAAKPGDDCGPVAGGLAVSPDGTRLLVANVQNDSVSLIDLKTGKVVTEQDLRPGKIDSTHHGEPGGTFPRVVTWISADRAYVASVRDREVISLAIPGNEVRIVHRLPVQGQPAALVANKSGTRLFVALDTSSQVAAFDTSQDALIEHFSSVAPPAIYDNKDTLGGANPNALALTADGRTLLVSNGGQNSVAVVRLSRRASDLQGDGDTASDRSEVIGLAPTGWYPTGIATSTDGATWYVVNAKSPMGPNAEWCRTAGAAYCDPKVLPQGMRWVFAGNGIAQLLAKNAHVNQLEHAGFLTMPAPDSSELARLTRVVASNNRLDQPGKPEADKLFAFLREHIKHVIYIMKENRSYDQILGDLKGGNGDPRLTLFPENISPNHHSIARTFVNLDNLLVSGEGSMNGVYWTFAAQTDDLLERTDTLSLATAYKGEKGGFPYGNNRTADIAYATGEERHEADHTYGDDADVLPGTASVYDVDGPGGEAGTGYLWNAALRAGLSVRDYGAFTRTFNVPLPKLEPRTGDRKTRERTQPLITRADTNWPTEWPEQPDFFRLREFQREFAQFSDKNSAPSLMLMFLGGDHLGTFDKAGYGVNTPETQFADNDYAVGSIVETVAKSPFAKDTLVITIEDDASDGPDHVDAERTVALFAGPYVRQHAVISTRYTTVNVVKTIEEILGMGPIGLNDAFAVPMSDIFDQNAATWSYKAIVPNVLRSTRLPLPPDSHAKVDHPSHPAAYWTRAMAGQDFSAPDRIEPLTFNRALWRGIKGDTPYPDRRTRIGPRANRAQHAADR